MQPVPHVSTCACRSRPRHHLCPPERSEEITHKPPLLVVSPVPVLRVLWPPLRGRTIIRRRRSRVFQAQGPQWQAVDVTHHPGGGEGVAGHLAARSILRTGSSSGGSTTPCIAVPGASAALPFSCIPAQRPSAEGRQGRACRRRRGSSSCCSAVADSSAPQGHAAW